MAGFREVFLARSKEAPFLVGILFAILAWGLTHIVDRILTAPTVEYKCKSPCIREGLAISCSIRNLSRDRRLNDLKLIVFFEGPDGKSDDRVTFAKQSIAWRGAAYPGAQEKRKMPEPRKGEVEFTVPALNPGGEIVLSAIAKGPTTASKLRLWVDSSDPVRAVQSSLATWAVRHELCLVFCLVVLTGVGMVLAVWLMPSAPARGKGGG